MPIRNPFARRSGPAPAAPVRHGDEIARPTSVSSEPERQRSDTGFERVDTVGSMASSALSIRSRGSQETREYKMSVVNDSGVFLPPSPSEEKGVWPGRYLSSRTSSETGSSLGEIEHFSISRESFDSYRRSFDISGKSPVPGHETRQSPDVSARVPRFPHFTLADCAAAAAEFEPPDPESEEPFEDVGLDDSKTAPPRRRGFFSKFSDPAPESAPAPATTVSWFPIPGRKRGHSQCKEMGSELGLIPRKPVGAGANAKETHAQEVH